MSGRSNYIMIWGNKVWYFNDEVEMTTEYHNLIQEVRGINGNINEIVVLRMVEDDPDKPSFPDRGSYVEFEPNFPIG